MENNIDVFGETLQKILVGRKLMYQIK